MSPPVRPGPPRTSGSNGEQAHEAQPPPRPPPRRPCRPSSIGLPVMRGLSDSRKRDLRSAVTSFAKLRGQPPAAIPLDLADIRRTLDSMVPARAKVSPKRWANLRSDLAAAIEASGLRPMLKTADLDLDEAWSRLLAPADQRIRHGLSRFARWASLRRIAPRGRRRRHDRPLHRRTGCGDPGQKSSATCPAPSRRRGTPLYGSIRALGCGPLRCRPTGLRRPGFLGSSFPARSRTMSSDTSPGRPCPTRSPRGRGQGPRTAEPAPAANAHPFGRECGGCGRDPRRSDHLFGEPGRTRDLPRPPAPSLARGRTQVVRLHPRCCRHADRDCLGMGEGVRRM